MNIKPLIINNMMQNSFCDENEPWKFINNFQAQKLFMDFYK